MASVPQEVIAPTVSVPPVSVPTVSVPPVSAEHLSALQSAVVGFDREQLIWSSGFLAGLAGTASRRPEVAPIIPVVSPQSTTWTIFFATETGNSRRVAQTLADEARLAGLSVKLQDLRDFRPRGLSKIENAMFVLATHGIGEAPEGTGQFFEFWLSDKAPRLETLNYSVLALGDSSYADFCETGKQFDERLRQLGAAAYLTRVDCDLDFEEPAASWTEKAIANAREMSEPVAQPRPAHLQAVTNTPVTSRDHPFAAEILTRQRITGRGSTKDVRHLELDLEGSGLKYLPGDSLGVIPQNPPQLVDALLESLNFRGNEEVVVNGSNKELREALLKDREITILSRPLLDVVASGQPRLRQILEHRERFTDYLKTRQLIDLVHEFPNDWQPQQFIDSLRGLTPRLYSIASSPDANPDEAHLTVALVKYGQYGRQHWGAASNFLTGDTTHAPIYVESNNHFRLPATGDTPIVMIGAGTGVAPYRAFIEHRREHGHNGKNWLFFGDRNIGSDFLYQAEWLRYRKDGLLDNLDVAFSRDQSEKIYVQHRLNEKSSELFSWLERGAHVYVCGDAEYMAKDVHSTLAAVVREKGGMSEDQATEYLNEMKRAGRYQRDVY